MSNHFFFLSENQTDESFEQLYFNKKKVLLSIFHYQKCKTNYLRERNTQWVYGISNLISISFCIRTLFNEVFFDDTFVRLFIFYFFAAFIKRVFILVWMKMHVRISYTVRGLGILMHCFDCNQLWNPSGNYVRKGWSIINFVRRCAVSTGNFLENK